METRTNNNDQVIPSTDQSTNNSKKNVIMEKEIKVTTNGIQRNLKIRMDFEHASRAELLEWAFANRVIAVQRALRDCTDETLNEFVISGYECSAKDAGVKPMTASERKAEMARKISKMSKEEKEAMLELLMG